MIFVTANQLAFVNASAKESKFAQDLIICAFGMLTLLISAGDLNAQRNSKGGGRSLPEVKKIDPEEGQIVIEKFRHQRLQGDFVFKFDLEHLPYRGQEKYYRGILMGTWNQRGPLNRMVLWPKAKQRDFEIGLLIQGGRNPDVWKVDRQSVAVPVDTEALVDPLLNDFIYTPFDLLMPFVFWENFEYEGSKRVRSRQAHFFRMYPPDSFKEEHPKIHCVRLKLDARYNALLSAEVLDKHDDPLRIFNVMSFDKVNDQYIVKKIDLIDKVSRDKTRMRVVMAAVNVRLSAELFDAELLEAEIPDLSTYRFEHL